MAAVAHPSPADIRRLALVRIDASWAPPASRIPTAVHRHRRVAAAVLVAGLLAVMVLAVGGLLASFGGHADVGPRATAPASAYVVQSGDTFWDIARRLQPQGDPRPLVARLVAAHGSPVLVAGERLPLPAT